MSLSSELSAESFLEYAFLRWVLEPAARPEIAEFVMPQSELLLDGRRYLIDYEIVPSYPLQTIRIAHPIRP